MATEDNDYGLTSLSRVKQHADIVNKDHDTELVRLIDEVSARIEGFLGRHLWSRTWTHDGTTLPRLDSCGGTKLFLPEYPVTDVDSLKVYPTASALTEGYDDDFVVDNSAGIIRLLSTGFYDAPQVVEITYTAGYATGLAEAKAWLWGQDTASADLTMAATKQVAWEFRQKDREREGVASRSDAGGSVSFLNTEWLLEVKAILNRHKRSYL